MRNNRKIRNWIVFFRISFICLGIIIFIFGWLYFTWQKLPSKIQIRKGEVGEFDFAVPAIAHISRKEKAIGTVDLLKPVTFYATDTDSYQMTVELFGFINFKETEVSVINDIEVKPVGRPIGIYIKTKGILVLQSGEFLGEDGLKKHPASLLQEGDYILAYNGENIDKKKELIERIAASSGEAIVLTIDRNGEVFDLMITPQKNEAGEYKLGIWVRDNAQGVGTMTYLTKDNEFGALGHGINDLDTAELMRLDFGNLYQAEIISITKGSVGNPGEMTGFISYDKDELLGEVEQNTDEGIYGTVRENFAKEVEGEFLKIGLKQEVFPGKVQILCTVNDSTDYYDAEIVDIYPQNSSSSRSFRIKITDEELIKETGGIVQGMSGSPIIQEGKIIGAVTHVLVQDPQMGYGIFIEEMLSAAEE